MVIKFCRLWPNLGFFLCGLLFGGGGGGWIFDTQQQLKQNTLMARNCLKQCILSMLQKLLNLIAIFLCSPVI